MRKILTITIVATLFGLTGCESFNRFEAWKKEALFGEPNPYNLPPGYGYPYQPGAYAGQPVAGQPMPPGMIQLQPGQPMPPGYAIVQPQPAAVAPAPVMAPQPVMPTGPQTLLPPALPN